MLVSVKNQVHDQVYNQVRNCVDIQLWSKNNQIYGQVWKYAIWGQFRTQVVLRVSNQVKEQLC